MSILAVMMGIGLGVFSRVNVAKFTALGSVRNVLRTARENAIANSLPVTVVCDGPNNRVFDLSIQPFAHWSFEDESGVTGPTTGATSSNDVASTGAFGLDARLVGAKVGMPGRTGAALLCAKQGDHAVANLGERGEWIFRDGIAVELDVWVDSFANATILKRGRQLLLRILPDGRIEAEIGLAEREDTPNKTGGQLIATTRPGFILPKRWSQIGVVYDRQLLTILVDGVPVQTAEASLPVISEGPRSRSATSRKHSSAGSTP